MSAASGAFGRAGRRRLVSVACAVAAAGSGAAVAIGLSGQTAQAATAGGQLSLYGVTSLTTGVSVAAGTSPGIASHSDGTFQAAFQRADGNVGTYGSSGAVTAGGAPIYAGVSPTIAALSAPNYELAFEAPNTDAQVAGSGLTAQSHYGMKAGTGLDISAAANGSFLATFQANTGNVYLYNSNGTAKQLDLGMDNATGPRIVTQPNSGYQLAFQANTGSLYLSGSVVSGSAGLGMASGSSPDIAAGAGSSFEVAMEANTDVLWTYADSSTAKAPTKSNTGLKMAAGSNPSIADLSNGTYAVAYRNAAGDLAIDLNGVNTDTGHPVVAGTSPAITADKAGYEVAYVSPPPAPTPTVTESTTTTVTTTQTTPPPPPAKGKPRINVRLTLAWSWNARTTRLRQLKTLGKVPRGTKVGYVCHGRSCPRLTRPRPRHRGEQVSVSQTLRAAVSKVFRVNDIFTVTISAPGYTSETVAARMRAGRIPRLRLG